ncbi:hypothetical protein [Catenuloplanes japonicus]|uniref:hypothetical protein n=1 Tax=Catenuloplanes japonicus TaxID=33876 RepID=UPI000527C6D9|nr:hypothetical protein [Catenuloplanes japonicus]
MTRSSLNVHPALLTAAAAVSSALACCAGGYAGALTPWMAIAVLGVTVLSTAMTITAVVLVRRPSRDIRDEVTAWLEQVTSARTGVEREDGPPTVVTGHRTERVTDRSTWLGTRVGVAAVLTFDDGSQGSLSLVLVPDAGDGWRVESVKGTRFRLALD